MRPRRAYALQSRKQTEDALYIAGEEEIEAIARVIRAGALFRYTEGSECDRFEMRYAHYLGCRHFALAASGSNALAAAMLVAPMNCPDDDCATRAMLSLPSAESAELFTEVFPSVIAGKTGRHN